MDQVEIAVIGAGVIGLAVARALARAGHQTLVLEAARGCATGISARSSEVIHAGLYYEPGSLKARLCRAGLEALYPFCDRLGIAYRRCGKLVVASSKTQCAALGELAARAHANGAATQLIESRDARALEPELACEAALLSPDSGIFDSAAYALALRGEAERDGAVFVFNAPVSAWCIDAAGSVLEVGESNHSLRASLVVNCAGLQAVALARLIEAYPRASLPRMFLAKGSYFALEGRAPFHHLVYPLPEAGGLGIHLTLDLHGKARFGPDVEWVEREDYRVDSARVEDFERCIRRYWPGLPARALVPAYAGIRPKLSPPGAAPADFHIAGPADHGLPAVHLFGIESPGLTASLALGEHVAALVRAL